MPPAMHNVNHQPEVEQLRQQVANYQNELKTYTEKFDRMYTLLESLINKFNDHKQDTSQTSQGIDPDWRL